MSKHPYRNYHINPSQRPPMPKVSDPAKERHMEALAKYEAMQLRRELRELGVEDLEDIFDDA